MLAQFETNQEEAMADETQRMDRLEGKLDSLVLSMSSLTEKLAVTADRLTRLDGVELQLNALTERFVRHEALNHHTETERTLTQHEKRIGKLETLVANITMRMAVIAGASGVGGFVLGLVAPNIVASMFGR